MAYPGYSPPPVTLDGRATVLEVWRYDHEMPAGSRFTSRLDHIVCEGIEHRAGAVPPSAQFRYVLDSADPAWPYPRRFEQVWPIDASDGGNPARPVVGLGDEIAVKALDGQGGWTVLFWGFADAPQVDLSPAGEHVTFTASGAAVRCWDTPVGGALYRDASDPDQGDPVPTELPARFNPDGQPNATPEGHDVGDAGDESYPLFLDPRVRRDPDPRAFWHLGRFARYLLNTRPDAEREFVGTVTGACGTIDFTLMALVPTDPDGTGTIDFDDPSTFTLESIRCDDSAATGRAWPEVLDGVLSRHGFALRFETTTDANGEPACDLVLDRLDGYKTSDPKDVFLAPAGSTLDPASTNVRALQLVRDGRDSCNQVRVISRPTRYEISVVLAPGFPIAAEDADTPGNFTAAALATADADTRRKYRVFVLDEAGDGHWDFGTGAWISGAPAVDLVNLFGEPAAPGDPPTFVQRLRPGLDELISKDDGGKPYRAELALSTDYVGAAPDLWNGTGTWQSLGQHGWRLLKDRLGVYLTCDNPNGWTLPKPKPGDAAVPAAAAGTTVRVVEALANPTANNPRFYLRLTCVIEGDHGVSALAGKRLAAPVPFTIERRVDARDVYRKDLVDKSSIHATGDPKESTTVRDDSDKARAQARAWRSAREFPVVAGAVTIPWLTTDYRVGDRIAAIIGRNCDLRTNGGDASFESPRYPHIVSVRHDFSGGGQRTILQLSDTRAAGALSTREKTRG